MQRCEDDEFIFKIFNDDLGKSNFINNLEELVLIRGGSRILGVFGSYNFYWLR